MFTFFIQSIHPLLFFELFIFLDQINMKGVIIIVGTNQTTNAGRNRILTTKKAVKEAI